MKTEQKENKCAEELINVEHVVKGKVRKIFKGTLEEVIEYILWSIDGYGNEDLYEDIELAENKEWLKNVLNTFNSEKKAFIIK